MTPETAHPARATGHRRPDDPAPRGVPRHAARRALQAIGAPYPPYLGLVVRDSIVVWVLVRATFAVALVIAGLGPVARRPPWVVGAALIALTALLVWLDRRRRRELLLPANLGVRGIWFWCASIISAALVDAASRLVLAAR